MALTRSAVLVLSKKVKNYTIHPTFQMDLQEVWLEQA